MCVLNTERRCGCARIVVRNRRGQEWTKIRVRCYQRTAGPTAQAAVVKSLHDRSSKRGDRCDVAAGHVAVRKTEGFDAGNRLGSIGTADSRIDDCVRARVVGDRVVGSIASQYKYICACSPDNRVDAPAGIDDVIPRSTIERVVAAVAVHRIRKSRPGDVLDIRDPITRCIAGAGLEVDAEIDRNNGGRVGISDRVGASTTIDIVRTYTAIERIIAATAIERIIACTTDQRIVATGGGVDANVVEIEVRVGRE